MLVTDSFVWINNPKTGCSFGRLAILELYRRLADGERSFFGFKKGPKRWIKELEFPELRLPRGAERRDAPTLHGTVDQIPEEYRHLPILSTCREPVDRFVSTYRYSDWKKDDALPAPKETLIANYPHFPELGFVDCAELFLRFGRRRIVVGGEAFQLGPLSVDVLNFFSRARIDADDGAEFRDWEAMVDSLAEVRLLHQENLKHELAKALMSLGYRSKDLGFIAEMDRVNESQGVDLPSPSSIEAVARLFAGDPLYPLLMAVLHGDKPAIPADLSARVRNDSDRWDPW